MHGQRGPQTICREAGCTVRLPVTFLYTESRVEKRTFTQEQYDVTYQFARDREDELSIMLMLEIGVSRSELLGLRWVEL